MRNLIAITLSLLVLSACKSKVQEAYFEGVISYNIRYTSVPSEMKPFEEMLPRSKKVTIKGPLSMEEKPLPMGGKQLMIEDTTSDTTTMLMDIMGLKMRVSIPSSLYDESIAEAGKDTIIYFKDEKVIAGFTCKKAIARNLKTQIESEIYYTEKIPASHSKVFPELAGFPLYYTAISDGLSFIVEATSISVEEVSDSAFNTPEGYKQVSLEQMQSMMGNAY